MSAYNARLVHSHHFERSPVLSILDWLQNGLLALSGWQLVVMTLVLTHITIVSVTVYLHRHSAHRALDLHPALAHFPLLAVDDDRHGHPGMDRHSS